jgi:hypothetical protein
MRATGLAIAAEERVVGGIDEDQGDGMILTKMLQERREFFELHAFASVDEQSGARKVALAGGMQFRKNGNQFNRKVVNAVEAHILESVEDGAFSRA